MRRAERARFERRRRTALTIGLWYALGALTALGLIWRSDHVTEVTRSVPQDPKRSVPRDLARSVPEDLVTAVPPAAAPARPEATSGSADPLIESLAQRRLLVPVDGVGRDQLDDTFDDRRAGIRRHEAIDIMSPRGTPVRAVADGHVAKLFTSVAGGLTIYLFDPEQHFAYYYAHLDRYAPGLREGQRVARGQVIGYVGSTGNAAADAPHLHFAIFHLNAERQWWKGDPLNPYLVLR